MQTKNRKKKMTAAMAALCGLCLQAGAQTPGPLVPAAPGPPRLIYGIAVVVDVRRGALQLAPSPGLAPVSVTLTPQTQIVALQTARVADLKIGDEISVQGAATELAVSSLNWNAVPPEAPSASAEARPPDNPARPALAGSDGAVPSSVTGRITSVHPLVVAFPDGASLTLRAAPDARVTRIASIPMSQLKAGAPMLAFGPLTGQSAMTADIIGVGFTPADLQFASSF